MSFVPFSCFIGGLLLPAVLRVLFKVVIGRRWRTVSSDRIYGLEHGVLNLEIPKSMWMNMGFWRDDPPDLASASEALLLEVLEESGIGRSARTNRKLIDLGFGCGDQTLLLTKSLLQNESNSLLRRRFNAGNPIFDSYVGITINKVQHDFAVERIKPSPAESIADQRHDADDLSIQLFHADAANPERWSTELKLLTRSTPDLENRHASQQRHNHETWVLGLDCLYHFKPSRMLIFEHAYSGMEASIMAFDLLKAEKSTVLDRILLRIIAPLASASYSNFLTQEEYKDQLVMAGYERGSISIRDISPHVFSGLTSFLIKQDCQLQMYGSGIGMFRAARWMFDWWARSGIVRGCIIVARR